MLLGSKITRTRLCIALAIATCAATAYAVSASGTDDPPRQTPAMNAEPNGAGPATRRLFSIFRRTRSASADALPALPPGSHQGSFGMDRSESRRIHATGVKSRAWALPAAEDYSCVAFLPPEAAGPGYGCNPSDGKPNVVYTGLPSGGFEVFGLVRDGYERATIMFTDGSRQTVDVSGNAFAAHAEAAPESISLTGSVEPAVVNLSR